MESWDPNLVAEMPVVVLEQEIPYTAEHQQDLHNALQPLGVINDDQLQALIQSMQDYDTYAEAVNNQLAVQDVATHVVQLLQWLKMSLENLMNLIDPHAGDDQATAHNLLASFHVAFTQTLALFAGRGYS